MLGLQLRHNILHHFLKHVGDLQVINVPCDRALLPINVLIHDAKVTWVDNKTQLGEEGREVLPEQESSLCWKHNAVAEQRSVIQSLAAQVIMNVAVLHRIHPHLQGGNKE